jgi:hypothetical protein
MMGFSRPTREGTYRGPPSFTEEIIAVHEELPMKNKKEVEADPD